LKAQSPALSAFVPHPETYPTGWVFCFPHLAILSFMARFIPHFGASTLTYDTEKMG